MSLFKIRPQDVFSLKLVLYRFNIHLPAELILHISQYMSIEHYVCMYCKTEHAWTDWFPNMFQADVCCEECCDAIFDYKKMEESVSKRAKKDVIVCEQSSFDKDEIISTLRSMLSNLHYDTTQCGNCSFVAHEDKFDEGGECSKCGERLCCECAPEHDAEETALVCFPCSQK
jgi:hypothetical protein